MIISLSGPPGSGKSTIAKMLAERLGWPRYYVGEMQRQAAEKRGMTLGEYNKLGETDPSTDTEVDEWIKKMGRTQDNFIIESRTSWHFIPHSIKIYVDVAPEEGARRMLKQIESSQRKKESKEFDSLEDVVKTNEQRMQSDDKRYQKYYGIQAFDKNNFDLVVDSTGQTPEQTLDRVWDFIEPRLEK